MTDTEDGSPIDGNEDALGECEDWFRSIFRVLPDNLTVSDMEGRILMVSPSAMKMFHCEHEEEMVGHLGMEFIIPADRDRAASDTAFMLQDKWPGPRDYTGLRQDGSTFPVEINGEIFRGKENEPRGMVFVIRDVSERKESMSALRKSEERYHRITEAITDYIYTVRVSGGCVTETVHGPGCIAVTGYESNEYANDPFLWYRMVVEEDRQKVEDLVRRLLSGEDPPPIEHRIFHKNGTLRWVSNTLVPRRDEHGVLIAYDGLVKDITERKNAADALRESNDMLTLFVQHSPIYTYIKEVTSTESRVVKASDNFQKMIGIHGSQMIGKTMEQLFPPEVAVKFTADDYRVVTLGKLFEDEEELDGRTYSTIKFPIVQGGKTLLAGFTIDITDRKMAEEEKNKLRVQLQQSQKMESLGVLAGGVAHDMNNVLASILGLASAFVEILPEGTPAHSAFDTIFKAAARGGEMVKCLLAFGRQTLPQVTEVDLNDILRGEMQMLKRSTFSKIRLCLELEDSLPSIRGDANALTHAFMNLCVNAVDAMPDGGTLTLRTRTVGKEEVEVLVEDTGTGMPNEVLAKALDPFFTTKAFGKGTGLGLSMVYSITKAHHGQLSIQSEPGRGTCVRTRFPVSEAVPQAPEPVLEPKAEKDHRALNVLLVDDDELIHRSSQMLLEMLGHPVHIATSGEEAITLLEGGFHPDVVILDMNMPGIGGAGTLPRLRVMNPAVPVLLATGRVDQVALDLVAAHPHVTLLSKPYEIKELKQRLDDAMRES